MCTKLWWITPVIVPSFTAYFPFIRRSFYEFNLLVDKVVLNEWLDSFWLTGLEALTFGPILAWQILQQSISSPTFIWLYWLYTHFSNWFVHFEFLISCPCSKIKHLIYKICKYCNFDINVDCNRHPCRELQSIFHRLQPMQTGDFPASLGHVWVDRSREPVHVKDVCMF